jgi:DNA invertase Pin-like site-specific DNA recombinase
MTPSVRAAVEVASVHGAADVAAIYVRQSRKKADGSEASPAVQVEESEKKAIALDLRSLPVYSDVGISGYDPNAERPAFERMLKDAAAGKFSKIIVYYMSRFSRQEPLEVLAVVRELWSYGITIISVTEGEFRPDDFGSLIHLLARLEGNHKESKLKSINVKKTKQKARNLGGYMGGPPPYGFHTRKVLKDGVAIQELVPDWKVQAPIVRDLVAYMLEHRNDPADKFGKHPASILGACEWLNAHPQAKPRRGETWKDASVTRLLIDPRLAGFAADYVYENAADEERRRKTRAYVIQRDDDGHEIIGNEAIVTPADWYTLQEHLRSRANKGRASNGESLFGGSGLVDCECGKLFTFFWARKTDVKNYRCPRTRVDDVGRTHDGGNSISALHLEDWVARRIFALITTSAGDEETQEILLEATRRYGRRVEAPQTAGERTELVRARAADTQALNDLYDREEAGDYDDPIGRKRFRDRKDKILTRIKAAESRLAELDTIETPALPIEQWLPEDADADPIGPGSWWHGASLDQRRDMVALFVERITVHKAASKGGNYNGVVFNAGSRAEITWARPHDDEEDA